MPINDDANARGGDRHDRGVGPDPSVHDKLVRSVFDNYIDLLNQQNAMRLGGELPPNPMDTQGGPVTIDRHAHDAAGPPTGEATHTLEGDPKNINPNLVDYVDYAENPLSAAGDPHAAEENAYYQRLAEAEDPNAT